MRNERFLATKVAVFEGGKLVPLWDCDYDHNPLYGPIIYIYEGKETCQTLDASWDLKKKECVSVFFVDYESTEEGFQVGDEVAVDIGNIIHIKTVKEIRKESEKVYYQKISDENVRVKKVLEENEIPEGTKYIGFRDYTNYYIFDGIEQPVHQVYVKKLER